MQSLVLALLCLLASVQAYSVFHNAAPVVRKAGRSALRMGLADLFAKAMAKDPSLPPAKNPGLSKDPTVVEVEFLPSKKIVKAVLGQSVATIAQAAKVDIKYGCKKGECGTCEVNFNGKIVKACQSSLPSSSTLKKFTIGVPEQAIKKK